MSSRVVIGKKLFLLATALIPFDNLVISPSAGWAPISPFLFFVSASLGFRGRLPRLAINLAVLLFLLIVSQFVALFVHAPILSNIIETLGTLLLGLSFYCCLVLYCGASLGIFVKYLLAGYVASWLITVAIIVDVPFVQALWDQTLKRDTGRFSFTFTEASFMSVHILGMMAFIVSMPSNVVGGYQLRKITALVTFLFISVAILFGDSARVLVDMALVGLLLTAIFSLKATKDLIIGKPRKRLVRALFLLMVCLVVGISVGREADLSAIDRIEGIASTIKSSLYYGTLLDVSDQSLIARLSRLMAIIYGWFEQLPISLIGFGVGGSYIPFQMGIYDALGMFIGESVPAEIYRSLEARDAQYYNIYVRVLAEFGLLGLALLLSCFFRSKKLMVSSVIAFVIYMQFDSYAFYTLWLLLYANSLVLREVR